MKVVILAGGLPSIIGEENDKIPKPMVTVGERPLLWHIMKLFSHYGYNEFIICAGFRSDTIKDYFMNYYAFQSDITVHLLTNEVEIHNHVTEPWQVSVIDTGLHATTAQRLHSIRNMVDGECVVVYGDCISDVAVPELVKSHHRSKMLMTAVLARPTGRNRILPMDAEGRLVAAEEGADVTDAWANACMMVVEPKVLWENPKGADRFEVEVMNDLASRGAVNVYRHNGFWMPVETVRDRDYMQELWNSGNVPWRVWED